MFNVKMKRDTFTAEKVELTFTDKYQIEAIFNKRIYAEICYA